MIKNYTNKQDKYMLPSKGQVRHLLLILIYDYIATEYEYQLCIAIPQHGAMISTFHQASWCEDTSIEYILYIHIPQE